MKDIKAAIIKRPRKGFTLLEVTTAISIMSILMLAIFSLFTFFVREFKNAAAENREDFYINEGLRFIENEICSGNKEVKFREDLIEIRRTSDERMDFIRESQGNLIIEYTLAGRSHGTNVFLKNISDFSIDIYEQLVIVNIVNSKGEVHRKCINTGYIK
ncbi:MAG: prepilin-type N-terminal cleavage/methylation domain-containing protein [Clostridia bacterium]|jgi:prepilin-type N-terminal cleavage/methylation domain-containing protein|nr:prepilin-type N-terminal cleavage/methylation domain-containing protein [Clostridia bacterium]